VLIEPAVYSTITDVSLEDDYRLAQETSEASYYTAPARGLSVLVLPEEEETQEKVELVPTQEESQEQEELLSQEVFVQSSSQQQEDLSSSRTLVLSQDLPDTEENTLVEDEVDSSLDDDEVDHSRYPGSRYELARAIHTFPELCKRYRLMCKIGEGTFSSVYKAIDVNHHYHDNSYWLRGSNKNKGPAGEHYVAVKLIHPSSSPTRILNEIKLLHTLRDAPAVVPIINAFRCEDQVALILPYFKHQDFRHVFSSMDNMDLTYYLHELFTALKGCHQHYIIHRDVKPSNFLYDFERRRGVLVDFGLAEKVSPHTPAVSDKRRRRLVTTDSQPLGYNLHDKRPALRANRAGTRGFRAPEVLFKVIHQTTAVDMWSVGVIMLSILSRRFPFFQSTTDYEALVELTLLFGMQAMKQTALLHDRKFSLHHPGVPQDRISLAKLCTKLDTKQQHDWTPDAFDLMERCLTLNPAERITADQALSHPLFHSVLPHE
jgi:cell division control protein 7